MTKTVYRCRYSNKTPLLNLKYKLQTAEPNDAAHGRHQQSTVSFFLVSLHNLLVGYFGLLAFLGSGPIHYVNLTTKNAVNPTSNFIKTNYGKSYKLEMTRHSRLA